MKSLQKEQNSTNDPQSAGINVQSPESKSTPRRLTLGSVLHLLPQLGNAHLIFLAKFHQNLSTKFSLLLIHFQILIHWVTYFIVLNCDKKVSFLIYEQNIWSYVHSVLKTEFCCALKISAVWLLLNWRDHVFNGCNSSLRKKELLWFDKFLEFLEFLEFILAAFKLKISCL